MISFDYPWKKMFNFLYAAILIYKITYNFSILISNIQTAVH